MTICLSVHDYWFVKTTCSFLEIGTLLPRTSLRADAEGGGIAVSVFPGLVHLASAPHRGEPSPRVKPGLTGGYSQQVLKAQVEKLLEFTSKPSRSSSSIWFPNPKHIFSFCSLISFAF